MRRLLITVLLVAVIAALTGLPSEGQSQGAGSDPQLPKRKQTTLGLYVTAKQAYEMWQAAPEQVKVLDVRTPEEYIFVGHPEMAWNIPFATQTYDWNSDHHYFAMKPDPDFVSRVKELFTFDDTLLAMCRSGDRSAVAANMLAEAGFKNVFTVIDGMEGDMVDDPDSAYHGKRMKNGWKNSGSPWTYRVDPERARFPSRP